MKKIIGLAFLLFTISSFAQTTNCNVTSYGQKAYDILKNLDKSQIPTGVLYENVFPFAEIEHYDGLNTQDSTNPFHFLQAYKEIYSSTYNRAGILHVSDFQAQVENFTTNKKFIHPVGIIDYNYNTIHPDAVSNNLISSSNGQLNDMAGRASSPYITKKAEHFS